MMVRKDIKEFLQTIPQNITLVAASKYADVEDMKILLESGIHNFGENRTDSFLKKYQVLKNEQIVWHFIGHLQRNKVKDIVNKIDYLHSLDSLKLVNEIEKYRQEPLKAFIEVSINGEINKNGIDLEQIDDFVQEIIRHPKIQLVGLMMMAIQNSDPDSLSKQFAKLRLLKEHLENKFAISLPYLSMGMSDDYIYAIKEGATHIRLGRLLFENTNK